MKSSLKTAIVAAALAALALASTPTDASVNDIQRKLILGGSVVSAKAKTYTVGLRSSADGENFCGGSLVSPIHVLTSSQCAAKNIRWASIGSLHLSGSKDGEQIKVAAVMNHPNFSSNIDFSSDFTLLELDTPSSYKPVKLAAADDSDFKAGAAARAIGWGLTGENGAMSNELLSVDLTVLSDKECKQLVTIDSTMLCVKGVISEGACAGDTGGPLVVESTSNGRDILVGVVSWNKDKGCGQGPFYPGMYSRVSRARSWIDPIIGSSCFD